MDRTLNISQNTSETFENDYCVINLNSEEITWKAGMFDPKLRADILYWLEKRNGKK